MSLNYAHDSLHAPFYTVLHSKKKTEHVLVSKTPTFNFVSRKRGSEINWCASATV